ncbi:MAG: nucleotidyl transferase AbiEii/AbiGii toxin family protein [Candidatus Sulfotelmatobacter sp.]
MYFLYIKSFYGEEDARIRVDLDVKEYDRIFLPMQTRRLIHSYSDAQLCQGDIRCLKLEEMLASKLKALLQRQHLPDLLAGLVRLHTCGLFSEGAQYLAP